MNNTCLPSLEATKHVIKNNPASIEEVQDYVKTQINIKFGFNKKFCSGTNCLILFFRNVTIDEYCLEFGKVGKCKPGNKCFISKTKQIYPSLRRLSSKERNPANTNGILKYIFMLIILLYHYFFNTFYSYMCFNNFLCFCS